MTTVALTVYQFAEMNPLPFWHDGCLYAQPMQQLYK